MNYVTSILLYQELLTNTIKSRPTKRSKNQADEPFLEASGGTPGGLSFIWISLKGDSGFYRDSLLCNVFVMNNVNYRIKTITASSELIEMTGKEYPSKLRKAYSPF